jgi:hypothetical protein
MWGRRRRDEQPEGLEGVVTFFGSHHALRAERVLQEARERAVLVPGPREISPNCGVALRFDYGRREQVRALLEEKLVQYEEIHYYPAETG